MKSEEIAQWVIDNRYPKNDLNKVSDQVMYTTIVKYINDLIGPEIDLDLLAVENEKKNQRIRELEEALRESLPYVLGAYECAFPDQAENDYVVDKIKQLLNQKP